MWQSRRLHPGRQRAGVLSEEDQGQEGQINVKMFDINKFLLPTSVFVTERLGGKYWSTLLVPREIPLGNLGYSSSTATQQVK